MTDARPELAWFAKAGADLEMARRALGPDQPLPDMACFHAQQCAEKVPQGIPGRARRTVPICPRPRIPHSVMHGPEPDLCRPHPGRRLPECIHRDITLSIRTRRRARPRSGARGYSTSPTDRPTRPPNLALLPAPVPGEPRRTTRGERQPFVRSRLGVLRRACPEPAEREPCRTTTPGAQRSLHTPRSAPNQRRLRALVL